MDFDIKISGFRADKFLSTFFQQCVYGSSSLFQSLVKNETVKFYAFAILDIRFSADPWIQDGKILKSPKSRYSILDRGALTTKVCGRNRSLVFSLSGRVWYRQIIFSIDFQLDFQDFQWFPRFSNENLGIRGFWYQDIVTSCR